MLVNKQYEIREDSGASEIIEAESIDAALTRAQEWVSEGSYDGRCIVTVYVTEIDPETGDPYQDGYYGDGRHAMGEVMAGPEPQPDRTECGDEDGDHDWQSPHELVGGLAENPGVWSRGGTSMVYKYVCANCGMYKTVRDTGAQRNPGELEETITYREADEASTAWAAATSLERA
jgi:hypothetical protein